MKRHCLNYSRSRGIDRIKSLKDTMMFTRVQLSTGFIPYVARVVKLIIRICFSFIVKTKVKYVRLIILVARTVFNKTLTELWRILITSEIVRSFTKSSHMNALCLIESYSYHVSFWCLIFKNLKFSRTKISLFLK
jgi:hypothetical protein